MALKFLNKKGWHTGSIRNIENVWKAEQKQEQENRKLEELKKQIHEEREKDAFRQLQEQAGLTVRQERLEFLYDSGLSVGKPSSEGFKDLQYPAASNQASGSATASASAPSSSQSAVPGALFEEKPQSANDTWRKLHSDPLLMIRQREQEALAKIKNNPVKMAMIRKSMEAKKKVDEPSGSKHQKKPKHKKHSSSKYDSDSESDGDKVKERRKRSKQKRKDQSDSDDDASDRSKHHRRSSRGYEKEKQRDISPSKYKTDKSTDDSTDRMRHRWHSHRDHEDEKQRRGSPSRRKSDREDYEQSRRNNEKTKHEHYSQDHKNNKSVGKERDADNSHRANGSNHSAMPPKPEPYKRRGKAPQLSQEEREARLREMQMDAEIHEEQRWKRIKRADEDDAREAKRSDTLGGKSFLDKVQTSVYGAEKGGSSTIEESVRRRSHFLQGRPDASERNAFRR